MLRMVEGPYNFGDNRELYVWFKFFNQINYKKNSNIATTRTSHKLMRIKS